MKKIRSVMNAIVRRIKKTVPRVVMFLMALVVTSGVIIAPAAFAADEKTPTGGNATSRTAAIINLAKNQKLSDTNASSLKPEELRILGTFASNFYVPFQSQFNYNGSIMQKDADARDATQKSVSSALQSTVGMSADSADSVAAYIIGNVWQGSVDLSFAYSDSDYWDQNASWTVNDSYPTDWRSFMRMVTGGDSTEESYRYFGSDDPARKAKWNALVYQVNGKTIPAFIWDPRGEKITPSTAALYQALAMTDLGNGYGSSLFDLSVADVNFSKSESDAYGEGIDATAATKALNDSALEQSTFSGKMAISPFGDIVYRGPNHTWVAIPASMNPSTWTKVDSSGTSYAPGAAFNTVSFQNLVLSNLSWQMRTPWEGTSTYDHGYAIDRIANSLSSADDTYRPLGAFFGKAQPGSASDTTANDGYFSDSWSDLKDKLEKQVKDKYKNAGLASDSGVHNMFGDNNQNTIPLMRTWTPLYQSEDKFIKDEWVGAHKNKAAESIYVVNKMVVLDDIQAFKGDVPEDGMYQDAITAPSGGVFAKAGNLDKNTATNAWQKALDPASNLAQTAASMPKPTAVSLYASYVMAAFGDDKVNQKMGWKYNAALPTVKSDVKLEADPAQVKNEKADAITNYLYFFLSPNWEYTAYASQLITSKISGLLIRWHDDMTGTQAISIVQGTTRYTGFAGYVSTPNLHDLSWTDTLIRVYNDHAVYLLLIILIILCVYTVMSMMSWKQALGSFAVFVVIALSIFPTINAVVNTANRFSNAVYSQKFTYWAVITHQTYATEIDKAAAGDDYSNYLQTVFNNSADMGTFVSDGTDGKANSISNRGGENILLKWQSPKKRTAVEYGKDLANATQNSPSLAKLLNSASQQAYGGETYLDDPNSTYLYRSYVDISNSSRYTYLGVAARGDGKATVNTDPATDNWPQGLKDSYKNYKADLDTYMGSGFANRPTGDSNPATLSYITPILSSKIVADHFADVNKLDNLSYNDHVGIPGGAYQFSLGTYTQGKSAREQIKTANPAGYNPDNEPYTDADYNGLGAFALASESPYYHFSWYTYDHGLSAKNSASGGYKDMLLNKPNQGFFYNNASGENEDETADNDGELKDYLGMKELFTYTIPYLKAANNVVVEYDKRYSLKTYPNLPFEPGHDSEFRDDPENRQKYWQNVNVAQLANMHSAWVDQLYDASYAKQQTIRHNGKTYTITDPLDPASYPEDRPMVFSPSEMNAYGLTKADLTSVESRIMSVLENSRKPFNEMLNYYSFQDSVLNSATSMLTTFEFNRAFSDTEFFGLKQGVQLYPQSYELKNFSYDSYLRLILSNSLQKDALEAGDYNFYKQVTQESSMTTSVMLIITDFLSIYVVPLLKYGTLLAIAVCALVFLLAAVFQATDGKLVSKACRAILRPLVMFLLITLGMTWFISLLMGDPVDGVTGQLSSSVRLGDPVFALLAICSLNIIVSLLYFRTLRGVFKDVRHYATAAYNSVSGVFGSALSKIAAVGGIGAAMRQGISNVAGGTVNAGQQAMQRRQDKKTQEAQAEAAATSTRQKKIQTAQAEAEMQEKLGRSDLADKIRRDALADTPQSSEKQTQSTASSINSKIKAGAKKLVGGKSSGGAKKGDQK